MATLRGIADRVRVVHPFPSFLNGTATFALALLADAGTPLALRLGVAMTAIQFSIGTLNDLVDAPRDRGRQPVKPIADGLIRPPVAGLVAILAGGVGFSLAALSGPATLVIAIAGAACGYAYDVRLSRTAWAWLPLAIALPLVPVFAWVGVTGAVPGAFLVLVPIGMLAGGGLAIGNALADLDADRAADASSLAVRLGRREATRLHVAALGATAAVAVITLPPAASPVAWAIVAVGSGTLGVGAALLVHAARRHHAPVARLGWQVEALGTAVLALGWVLALVGSGLVAG